MTAISAAQMTAAIYRLALRAWQAPNRRAAIFRMANETHEVFPYERALFFDLEAATPRLAAISGYEDLPRDAPHAAAACKIAASARRRGLGVLRAEDFPDLKAEWQTVCPEGTALWLPLTIKGENAAALWLERPDNATWTAEEIALLGVLAEGYASALAPYRSRWRAVLKALTQRRALTALVVIAIAALAWPIPMRVMAPCEVVAENPTVVTAPLNGVIAEVLVKPGQRVETGDLLFRYDDRAGRQDLEVAERQVSIVRAQLDESLASAMREREAQARTRILQAQLAQEEARLELARYICSRLEIKAPKAGLVEMPEPAEWQGRPVKVGERLLRLLSPECTRVRFWVAERDRLPGLEKKPARVFLPSVPSKVFTARILWLNTAVQNSPQGVPSFLGEAEWQDQPPTFALGQQGQIALYGEKSSSLHSILRKPLAALRPWLGW